MFDWILNTPLWRIPLSMLLSFSSTIGNRSNWDSLYFQKNVPKKDFASLKVTLILPPTVSVLCLAWKAMSGSADQKWATKLAISTE